MIGDRIYQIKYFTLFITTDRTITKLNLGHSDKFEIEIVKVSRCGSRSSNNAEFGHVTLLFCRGHGKEMYQELQRRIWSFHVVVLQRTW